MKVYQLKLLDLNIVLDPVFNTIDAAQLFKNKYKGRRMEILEKTLEPSNDTNYIYRILTTDVDGSYLEEEVFSSIESSFRILKNNQKIVKENIINLNTFKYVIEDVQ